MELIDLKLKLFGGMPIKADGFGDIFPLKVREIIDFGYSEYMRCLNLITLELSDLVKDPSILEDDEISAIDFLIAFGGEEIEKMLEKSLTLFLGGEVVIDKNNLQIFVKRNEETVLIVNRNNYHHIQEVIKWQNYINNFEEKSIEDFNPADDETRKFKEKMEKLKKEREKAKKKKEEKSEREEGNDIDFFDIVDSISTKSNSINELNVLDLTVYQVYRKFKRMQIIDQYDISIKSILAGAKDVKITHWSSKG